MSDVMLLGVLRMPMPDNPADMGGLEWAQVKDRMRQAADEIEKERAAVDGHIRLIEVLEDEVARLRAELHATVCNHDAAIEGWRKRVETVEAELAAERERTTKKDERIDELMGKCVVYAAKQAKLREALEPFAQWSFETKDDTDPAIMEMTNDLRRARAALKETGEGDG
jgi:chromosome segregation ATPase